MRRLHRHCAAFLAFASSLAFAASPQPLADFAKPLQFEKVRISPEGGHLAAVSVIEGRRHLTLIDLGTMKSTSVRPAVDDELQDFFWASEDRVVYTVGVKLGGIDRPISSGELFSVNADGSGATTLYGFRASGMQTGSNIKQTVAERGSARPIDRLKGNKREILVAIDLWSKEGDFSEIVRMDTRTGKRSSLFKAPMRRADFVVDHKGNPRFAFGEDDRGQLQVHYRKPGDGKWELVLSESAEGVRAMPLAFARDDETVYWACGAPKGESAVCTWNDKQRELKPVWTSPVERDDFVYSFDGLDVVGIRSMPGRPALSALAKDDPTFKAIVSLMQQFPGDTVEIVSTTDDGKKAVVLLWADVNPGAYYLLDRDASKLTHLIDRAPWIDIDRMAPMEPVELKSRDGLALRGYLTRPPGKPEAKNLPLVVMPHGGPYGIRDHWEFDPYLQAIASRGYAVLQVNFRGSGGYGYAFERAGYGEWGAKMQDDVTDATKWAISEGIADPKRICIYGVSYGGYAALNGAVREPDLYRCAIGDAGVYDLNLMYSRGDIQQSVWGEQFLQRVLGTDKTVLSQRSPALQLDRLKAKVMLIAGGQDRRVPPVHAERVQAELTKRGIAHEWLYKRGEGHGFYLEPNRVEMLEKLVAFLDANIGTATP